MSVVLRVSFLRTFFILLSVLIPFSFVQAQNSSESTKKNSKQDPSSNTDSVAMKSMLGMALSEEKQGFETHVASLLFVSLDDKSRGFGVHPIDIESKRKYFSEDGWQMYKQYRTAQKEVLSSKIEHFSHPEVSVIFEYGSQAYEFREGVTSFTARIRYCLEHYDMRSCAAETYWLSLSAEGNLDDLDPNDAGRVIITHLEVSLPEVK